VLKKIQEKILGLLGLSDADALEKSFFSPIPFEIMELVLGVAIILRRDICVSAEDLKFKLLGMNGNNDEFLDVIQAMRNNDWLEFIKGKYVMFSEKGKQFFNFSRKKTTF